MKIYAYLRVSTDQQVESGAGLDAQREACEAYAKSNRLTIQKVFCDEGVSGAADMKNRHGLMEAINTLEKGDIILVAKRDRLARDKIVIAAIEKYLKKKKARIVSAAGEGTESDDPSGRMMSGMVDVFSVYEREMICLRTKAALAAMKRDNKRVGHIPFGYRLSEDGVHLEEDEGEQDILRQMLALQEQGLSLRNIAEELNNRQAFNRGLSKWNHASVHRITKRAA